MRIIFSYILITTFWFSELKTENNQIPINEIEYENGKYSKDGKAVSGQIVDYYENDILKFRYNALDGRLHGEALLYFPDGKIKSRRNYTFNKLFGEFTEYNEQGEVVVTFNVDLNAYKKGEIVESCRVKKGNRLKSKGEGVIYFVSDKEETFSYSEEISILEQTKYYINDSKGNLLFQNF